MYGASRSPICWTRSRMAASSTGVVRDCSSRAICAPSAASLAAENSCADRNVAKIAKRLEKRAVRIFTWMPRDLARLRVHEPKVIVGIMLTPTTNVTTITVQLSINLLFTLPCLSGQASRGV